MLIWEAFAAFLAWPARAIDYWSDASEGTFWEWVAGPIMLLSLLITASPWILLLAGFIALFGNGVINANAPWLLWLAGPKHFALAYCICALVYIIWPLKIWVIAFIFDLRQQHALNAANDD